MDQERSSLNQIVHLLQRIAAKNDPITRGQVYAFMQRPAGPIIPDNCLRVEKLDSFEGEPLMICEDPNGAPWIFGRERGEDARFFYRTPGSKHDIIIDSSPNQQQVELCGFVPTGNSHRPVCIIRYESDSPEKRRRNTVWQGNVRILEQVTDEIESVRIGSDGFFLSIRSIFGSGICRLDTADAKPVIVLRSNDQRHYRLASCKKTLEAYVLCFYEKEDRWEIRSLDKGTFIRSSEEMLRLVPSTGRIYFTERKEGGTTLYSVTERGVEEFDRWESENFDIIAVIDDTWYFIEKSRGGVCMSNCFGHLDTPIFDLMGLPFKKGTRVCYWGLTGDHLCLMEFPQEEGTAIRKPKRRRTGARLLSETVQPDQVKRLF